MPLLILKKDGKGKALEIPRDVRAQGEEAITKFMADGGKAYWAAKEAAAKKAAEEAAKAENGGDK